MANNKATLIRIQVANYEWLREKSYKRNISQSKIVDELITKEKENERRDNTND